MKKPSTLTKHSVRIAEDVLTAFDQLCGSMSRSQAVRYLVKRKPESWIKSDALVAFDVTTKRKITSMHLDHAAHKCAKKWCAPLELSLGGLIEHVMRRAIAEGRIYDFR